MKNLRKRRKNNLSVNVALSLILPMLFMLIASFGYASLNSTIYTVAYLESPNYDIEITNCNVESYNGLYYEIFYNENEVSFNDSNIFPGWELILNITIHNKADSWVCKLTYTIYYWNETLNTWVITDPNTLLNLFRMEYQTTFYNSTGDIITGNPELYPCQSVYKVDHLKFVASNEEYQELLFQTLQIKIEVLATYPDPIPEGGE